MSLMPTAAAPSLAELYAPIRGELANAQQVFDRELVSEFSFVNQMCDTVRSYRGKMLRPALVLLTGRAFGPLTPEHVTVAAVVEMVHMATLVHDDVLDGATVRRLKPTIAVAEGNTAAVLLGDYLISHAFHLCSSLPDTHASRRIGAVTNVICEGELLQNRRCRDIRLSPDDYVEIARRKTGALTAVAGELGAHFSGAAPATVKALYSFGEEAGIAFQIMDDVLDLTGDPGLVGKTLGRDMAQGKLTLPFVFGLEMLEGRARAGIVQALTGPGEPDANAVALELRRCGAVDRAVSNAKTHVHNALRLLENLPSGEARNSLQSLTEFIIDRAF